MSVDAIKSALAGPSRSRDPAQARALIGWLARQTGAVTLAEMGAHFNRDATTLSRQVGCIELESRSSAEYAKDMKKHINALTQASDPVLTYAMLRTAYKCLYVMRSKNTYESYSI